MSGRTRVVALVLMALVALMVYGALVVLLFQPRAAEPAAPPPAQEEPVEESDVTTARELYPQAEALALAWQADAQLMSASAAWREPTKARLLTETPTWVFLFYSPAAGQVYRVSVAETGAEGAVDTHLQVTPTLIDTAQWEVDSENAMLLFLSNEGRDFLLRQQVTTVRMRLSAAVKPGRLVWMVAALSSADGTGMSVMVDATSGSVEVSEPPTP